MKKKKAKKKIKARSDFPAKHFQLARVASSDDAVLSAMSTALVYELGLRFDLSKVSLKDLDSLETEFKFLIRICLRDYGY